MVLYHSVSSGLLSKHIYLIWIKWSVTGLLSLQLVCHYSNSSDFKSLFNIFLACLFDFNLKWFMWHKCCFCCFDFVPKKDFKSQSATGRLKICWLNHWMVILNQWSSSNNILIARKVSPVTLHLIWIYHLINEIILKYISSM